VAYVQNGAVPMKYTIGAVDGKTSWSNYSILGTQLNDKPAADPAGSLAVTGQPRTDMAAGAGLEIVSLVGKAIADSSMKDDPAYYDRLLARMVGQRQVTSAVAPQLLPALARA
jgi:hypothetical protein